MRREERIARQDRDAGAADETVFVARVSQSAEFYHDQKDCHGLRAADDPQPVTRAAAQRRWLAPCSLCVLEVTPGDASPTGPRIVGDGEVVWGG